VTAVAIMAALLCLRRSLKGHGEIDLPAK